MLCQNFLEWRRHLAGLQESYSCTVTPYEKNLQVLSPELVVQHCIVGVQFWRQLWRVVERSDLVIQIVDCRHPLLFRCQVCPTLQLSTVFMY